MQVLSPARIPNASRSLLCVDRSLLCVYRSLLCVASWNFLALREYQMPVGCEYASLVVNVLVLAFKMRRLECANTTS